MDAVDPLDTEAWNRYIPCEYAPDRLPPEAEPADEEPGSATLRAATLLCLRCHFAVPPAQAREYAQFADRNRRQKELFAVSKIVRPLEMQELRRWAQGEDLLLDGAGLKQKWIEQGKMGGAEHEVHFDPVAKRWLKQNNLVYHSTYLEYFHRLALHNYLFPEAPVCLEGFVACDKNLMPVLSQPNVRVDCGATREVTEEAMGFLKFERQRDDNYYSRLLGIVVEDLHDENVVFGEDGELYVIDPGPYLDDRGKGARLRLRAEGQG